MAAEPLLVVGAGGFGREAVEVVRAVNAAAARARWDVLGFLDDDPTRWGARVSGTTVVGPVDSVHDRPGTRVVVCTGNPRDFRSKAGIVRRLGLDPGRYATLVHPAAALGSSCRVGEGSVVQAGVVATADVTIGPHAGLMPQVVLTHDDQLGAYTLVGAGARLAGGVAVGEGAYLGAGCLLREGVRVGARALVGMGAVVTRDVPPAEVWAGVPARFLRPVDAPDPGAPPVTTTATEVPSP
jgi:sugar O-acyltransferase (sialic acid O-acetyltransferase NeuD family)